MKILDGKSTAEALKKLIKAEVEKLLSEGKKRPHLGIILVGNDGASETYVNNKIKDCEEVGFKSTLFRLEETVSQEELLDKINLLNSDNDIDGFIVQLPLPKHINEQKIIESIDPKKDVDGFHPVNVGRMVIGLPSFVSATPAGILELLKFYNIKLQGKHVVVIGRSNIVGRPLSILLSQKGEYGDATVTLCHSKTKDISELTKQADIVIAAIGSPEFLKADMVKEGAIVIDVGTTRVKSENSKTGYKLVGDVKFDEVAPKCEYITPVPGGVGPMTRISLLINTLKAAKKQIY